MTLWHHDLYFTVGLQLLRKRHIGNDIVTIVFQEPGALPFSPHTVRSQFQHVFVIVRVTNPNSENTHYRLVLNGGLYHMQFLCWIFRSVIAHNFD